MNPDTPPHIEHMAAFLRNSMTGNPNNNNGLNMDPLLQYSRSYDIEPQRKQHIINTGISSSSKDKTSTPMQSSHQMYSMQQRTLDDWLDNCMKNPSAYLASSSSEYLDTSFHSMNLNRSGSNQQANPSFNNPMRLYSNIPDPSIFQKYLPSYSHDIDMRNLSHKMPSHLTAATVNNEFASLPPVIPVRNGLEGSGSEDLLDGLERTRRFSDPCLAAGSDNDESKAESEMNSMTKDPNLSSKESGNNNNTTSRSNIENKKMLSTLLAQINLLHETNTKICRNLHETKVEVEALKHAPNWGLRHRRDSISGLSTHSQPLGYHFGTQSPAPTYHSGMGTGIYTPGMLTDVVREVKEAARIREEALLSRVRALVEERSWNVNETNLKMIRDLEDIKTQVSKLTSEKKDTFSRILKLEDEIKSLRPLLSHALNYTRPAAQLYHSNSFSDRDILMRASSSPRNSPGSTETMRQKRNSLNINYGVVQHEDGVNYLNENDVLRPMNQRFDETMLRAEKLKYGSHNGGVGGGNKSSNDSPGTNRFSGLDDTSVISDTNTEQSEGHLVQMEKDTLELRRELQDALASKKHADARIEALENIVKNLSHKMPSHNDLIAHSNGSSPGKNTSNVFDNGGPNSSATPSPLKAHIASQIQSVASKHVLQNNVSMSGPVTDL